VSDLALDVWIRLAREDNAPLRRDAAGIDAERVQEIARLRRTHDHDLVRAALELARARRVLARKWTNVDDVYADVDTAEMATPELIARYKAQRFAQREADHIIDGCAGIGGDAMALRDVGDVTPIEHHPVRQWMCARNTGIETRDDDVTTIDLANAWLHLDPERRAAGGARHWRLDDYVPGQPFIDHCVLSARGAAIKVGPGVAIDDFATAERLELDYVSVGRVLVQAIAWSGDLTSNAGMTRSTILPSGQTLVGEPRIDAPVWSGERPGQWIYEADPSVERARLLAQVAEAHDLAEVHPGLGLLTGDHRIDDSSFRRFECLHAMPWKLKALRAWFRSNDAGVVTVKTRDRVVDPDMLARQLSFEGTTPYVVFIVRCGTMRIAWVTRRDDGTTD